MYERINEEVMVKTLLGCKISDITKTVIISPVWSLESFIKKAEVVKESFKGWYKGVTLEYKGKDITIINSCIGAPLTGDCVIALGYTECENIIFSGSAGGIDEMLNFGDLIVCQSAVIGEGFSRYHLDGINKDCFGQEIYGSEILVKNLMDKTNEYARKLGVNAYKGKVFSTDSILGENKESFAFMTKKGCHAVEMELSAVFTASKSIGRKAIGIVTVSDLPLKQRSLFEGVSEEDMLLYRNSANMLPEILMETVLEI